MNEKKIAKIWFNKGLWEFSTALEKGKIPNWIDYFDKLWTEFTTIKLKCLICRNIKTLELDFFDEILDINKYLNRFINLICSNCGFVDINKWERIR